jgi:SAM-dependent methyltransferase
MRSPLVFQPLEAELEAVAPYLRGTVLNAGCGGRDISAFLYRCGASTVHHCDLEGSVPGMFRCSLSAIPLRDMSYDAVVCNAVLEHVARHDMVLRELRRVLKPGGHLILSVPFLQPFHACPSDFRRFTAEGLRELADVHGLEVVGILPVHSLAQTVSWIVWEALSERRSRALQGLLWVPLHVWCRRSQATDARLRRNANTFQLIARRPPAEAPGADADSRR